jgi:hypothetical protein
MPLALLTFVTGISISIIAIYYSVLGLAAIFAAAVIPIIVMGTVLELGKLVTAWWLKANWHRAPLAIKTYLTVAVAVLMIITSMGIFGFLSKAHTDQAVPTGDVAAQVAIIDEKIKTQRDNIEASRRALLQMDAQVDQLLGRSADEKGAERAVQVRRNQARERARLQTEITVAQTEISKLNEEKAPIASKLRAVEAEVGPIKYIAKLIYGDDPDQNILEKAVTWVIIIIVFVFDPLAVLLLLASQLSFQWARQERNQLLLAQQMDQKDDEPTEIDHTQDDFEKPIDEKLVDSESELINKANAKIAEIEPEVNIDATLASVEQAQSQDEKSAIDEWNEMIAEAEKEAEKEKSPKQKWKEEHPDQTIKFQEKLKETGVIGELPWESTDDSKSSKYQIFPELQTDTSTSVDSVTESEDSKKKSYIVKKEDHQIKKTRE